MVCASSPNLDLVCSSGDGDESKLFAIKADGVTTFFSSIGTNTGVEDVKTVTNVPVDVDDGFGEVKPSKGSGPWTTTTFSPEAGSAFAWDGLLVRGQIEGKSFDGDLFATVMQSNGVTTSFEWTGSQRTPILERSASTNPWALSGFRLHRRRSLLSARAAISSP